jgi:hypothetical protein
MSCRYGGHEGDDEEFAAAATGLTGRVTDPRHHVGQEDALPREKEQTTSMPKLPAAV